MTHENPSQFHPGEISYAILEISKKIPFISNVRMNASAKMKGGIGHTC